MVPQELLAHLEQLAARFEADSEGLAKQLFALSEALDQAVSGFVGLQLVVVRSGHPVALDATTADLAHSAQSSLRLPLQLLEPSYERAGRIVFYSTVPGAFVDLAADLTYAFGRITRQGASIEVDVDLPLVREPLVTGLEDLAVLSRAAGVLIQDGHEPSTVDAVLRERAASAGLSPWAYAASLLDQQNCPNG